MQSVVETASFQQDAKEAGMGRDEVEELITYLAQHPTAGELMVGTGGARKLRWRRPGAGKSGGYRVVTYYAGAAVPVFLLAAYTKGDRANLSAEEKNALRVLLGRIADAYRPKQKGSRT